MHINYIYGLIYTLDELPIRIAVLPFGNYSIHLHANSYMARDCQVIKAIENHLKFCIQIEGRSTSKVISVNILQIFQVLVYYIKDGMHRACKFSRE